MTVVQLEFQKSVALSNKLTVSNQTVLKTVPGQSNHRIESNISSQFSLVKSIKTKRYFISVLFKCPVCCCSAPSSLLSEGDYFSALFVCIVDNFSLLFERKAVKITYHSFRGRISR